MLPYQVNPTDEHASILDLLAQACSVAGDRAKARETCQKITALTTGRMAWGATYARSDDRLGLIAGRQGDKARAREQFRTFRELWKDADQGLPEVADARTRLAPQVAASHSRVVFSERLGKPRERSDGADFLAGRFARPGGCSGLPGCPSFDFAETG